MSSTARAVVALAGRTLRYAEAEPSEPEGSDAHGEEAPRAPNAIGAGRLKRLGTCEFDFDVDEAVLGMAGAGHLDTVAAAVREVFEGTAARTLVVAAHPTSLVGFLSALPDGLSPAERHEQLRQEAALLADTAPQQTIRIRAVPVRAERLPGLAGDGGGPHTWHYVIPVPEAVHARVVLLARAIGATGYELRDTTAAAAAAVPPAPTPEDAPFTLAAALYSGLGRAGHAEFALVRDGAWYAGHHAPADGPEDAAYFALSWLDRMGLGPPDVGRLVLYGEAPEPERFALLADVLGRPAEVLDPLAAFGAAFGNTPPAAPTLLAAYAPCLGALLR